MKNQFLRFTISAILGTAVVYALMKLESFIHRSNNPEYADMVGELAEFAIPDLGLIILFFTVVYPYQFIVRTLQRRFEQRGFSTIRTSLIVIGISTFLYAIGFTIIFRSPDLGTSDTIQTFGLGLLISGVYFLTNLSTHNFLTNSITQTPERPVG